MQITKWVVDFIRNKWLNLAASLLFVITILLIWTLFFSSEDDLADPFPVIESLDDLIVSIIGSPLFLIVIVVLLILLIYDPLFFILFKPFINMCPYCWDLRQEKPPYIINGKCGKCGEYMCSKCFNYDTKQQKKSFGCPECGSIVFIPDKRLGYIRVPRFIRDRMYDSHDSKK